MADLTHSQERMEETEDAETVPLSPTRIQPRAEPMRGGGSTCTPAAEQNLDMVDPFTFKPPFTLCDKLLVRVCLSVELVGLHRHGAPACRRYCIVTHTLCLVT